MDSEYNELFFYKFHGAGNDFVLFEHLSLPLQPQWVEKICHRNFGVGGDGLMVLGTSDKADFTMHYFNSDGQPSSFCGNGARCLVAFAHFLGKIGLECSFEAYDGIHKAKIHEDGLISIQMKNVSNIQNMQEGFFLDTGSPHLVCMVEELSGVEVYNEGKKLRNLKGGTNVNFIQPLEKGLLIDTYERGVENETLACGTGITAAAIVWSMDKEYKKEWCVPVYAKGGDLEVKFEKEESGLIHDIWLKGPAEFVFSGKLSDKLWKSI
jgi:diaminopimelate epimerase